MKNKSKIYIAISVIVVIAAVVASTFWFKMPIEQRNIIGFMMKKGPSYDNYKEYQTVDRNETALFPTSFQPVIAKSDSNENNSNITVITEILKNEKSKMVKKAMVQPNGNRDYAGWQIIADEGFEEGVNTFGPSPLSYLTTGIAANLHSQIIRAANVMNIELGNVKVEVLNKFHWENMMDEEGAGYLGETYTNIIIESNESEETIKNLKEMAIKSWAAGEGLTNATTIKPSLVINGENWENYRAMPGTTLTDESIVDEMKISQIIKEPKKSDFIVQIREEDRDMSMDAMSNLTFQILAISESANDIERPNLKKITVSFNTSRSETWELYSDEITASNTNPIAPTSLEYVTAGTALCLTSQLTLVCGMMDLDFTEFRVEQQIDYREENVNSESMASFTDIVHSSILIESNESDERLNKFYQKSLALCFAGEAFKGATEMHTKCYLNGKIIK